MKKLYETVNPMLCDDYKERFKAEYHQLKIRLEKLHKFINRIEAHDMVSMAVSEPVHDCPLYLLQRQECNMMDYLKTLELRAVIENIDLED